MNEMKQVGRKIRLLREIYNYTQEYVAENLGISQNAYSMMETGETRLTIDRLGKLAELYKMEVSDLLQFNEQTVIHHITHSQGICSEQVHIQNPVSEEERDIYKKAIERLEKENEKLHLLIDKLTQRLSA